MASTEGVLRIVNRHFPKVTKVIDAKENLKIEVTSQDEKTSKRRNLNECAMAVACKRAYKADGVILARSTAYLVKDTLAVRFKIPVSVAREITSFDRGAQFAPGIYHLSRPAPSFLLTAKTKDNLERGGKGGNTGKSRGLRKIAIHRTTGIRAVLGGLDDKG